MDGFFGAVVPHEHHDLKKPCAGVEPDAQLTLWHHFVQGTCALRDGRSRDVRPLFESRSDGLGAVHSLAFSARHHCRKFFRSESNGYYLGGCGPPRGAAPASPQRIDVVARFGFGDPFIDLSFVNLLALNCSLHALIVIRRVRFATGRLKRALIEREAFTGTAAVGSTRS